jgi:hypothetical protein
MEYTIANIRILDVVRLVHGYFIFVFLIINMLSKKNRSVVELETQIWQILFFLSNKKAIFNILFTSYNNN